MREDRGENSSIGEITTLWSKQPCRTYIRCIVRNCAVELLAFKSLLINFKREEYALRETHLFYKLYGKNNPNCVGVCLLLTIYFANGRKLSALWAYCFQITAWRLLQYNNWLLTLSYTQTAAQWYSMFKNIKLSKCHIWIPTNKTYLSLRCLVKLRPCSPVDLNVKSLLLTSNVNPFSVTN